MHASCCAWPGFRAVQGLPAPAAGRLPRLGLIGDAGLAGRASICLRDSRFARTARPCLPPPAAWTAAGAAPFNTGWLARRWARWLAAAVRFRIRAGHRGSRSRREHGSAGLRIFWQPRKKMKADQESTR